MRKQVSTTTYDLAASLAMMSENEIESCRGLFRVVVLCCRGLLLLPPSCDDGERVGTKPKGLVSSFGNEKVSNCGVWESCGTGGWGGDMAVPGADDMAFELGFGFGFDAMGGCCNGVDDAGLCRDGGGAASGVAPAMSAEDGPASSGKKVLKTPLCCQA